MTKQRMTADELLAELANDSSYQEKMRVKEVERSRLRKELDDDQREIVDSCRAVGVPIKALWDLVATNGSYRFAIPILVEHLFRPHLPQTIEGIVRALTTPESKGYAFDYLVRFFRETADSSSQLKALTGAAIAEAATEQDASVVIELIKDESHGFGRTFLPLALVQLGRDRARPILESLLSEKDLADNARKALSRLK
jgi:hypothetical protein